MFLSPSLPLRAAAFALVAAAFSTSLRAEAPSLPPVVEAMQKSIESKEITGAVTVVANGDAVLHLAATGLADQEAKRAMAPDTLFWIASMTKPVIGACIMQLQAEEKLKIEDPVEKYVPELAGLKLDDGTPQVVTIRHLLTHTSGMREATEQEQLAAKTLKELMPAFAKPLHFKPGSKWNYSQTGINTLGRIIEVVSGQELPAYLEAKIFGPLGMKNTTFYPSAEQMARVAAPYKKGGEGLVPGTFRAIYDPLRKDRFPAANGGIFSTGEDYIRFAQMLLNDGQYDGKQILSAEAVQAFRQPLSGEVVTGFTPGNRWGAACCIVQEPQGISRLLAQGTFGHGGAYGTQVWIDPVKKRVYLLLIARSDIGNSDNSTIREAFQTATVAALDK